MESPTIPPSAGNPVQIKFSLQCNRKSLPNHVDYTQDYGESSRLGIRLSRDCVHERLLILPYIDCSLPNSLFLQLRLQLRGSMQWS